MDPKLGWLPVQFAVLGAVLIAIEFLVDGSVGMLPIEHCGAKRLLNGWRWETGGRIGGWLAQRRAARRRIDVATGGLFIGLGVRLAVER